MGLVILAAFVNVMAVALLLCILKCFKAAVCMSLFFLRRDNNCAIFIEQYRHHVQKCFHTEKIITASNITKYQTMYEYSRVSINTVTGC